MTKPLSPPVEMTVGYNRVEARWMKDTAIWTSDYFHNQNPEHEVLQFERRSKDLAQRFERYKLIAPHIEVLDPMEEEVRDPFLERAPSAGSAVLRVSTHLIPYVNKSELYPIVELRIPAPMPADVEHAAVVRDLRAGGSAVFDSFASAMTPRS